MSSRQLRLIALACGLVFGSLLALAPSALFLLALLATAAGLWVLRTPVYGLLGFAFVACCMPFSTFQLGVRITLPEALLLLSWLGAARLLLMQRITWHWGRTETRLLLLMAYSTLPFLYGQLVIQADGNGLVNWLRWLLNLSVLQLVPLLLDEPRRREQLLIAILGSNLLMLVVSLGLFVRHRNALDLILLLKTLHYAHPEALQDILGGMHTRLATPWVHPNLSGGAVLLFVPIAWLYGLQRRGWKRWLGASTAALGAIALVLTGSRGALLSLAILMLWMAWRRVPTVRLMIVYATLATALVAVCYPPLQQRLATMFAASNASTTVRMDEYRHFPQAMARYPLGIGFKTDPPIPGSGLWGISNLWLNYIYKLGLPGMLLFCLVLASWWRETRPGRTHGKLNAATMLWLSTLFGLSGALLTGLFDHYYSFTMILAALFWLIMSVNLQAARALSRTDAPPAPPPTSATA